MIEYSNLITQRLQDFERQENLFSDGSRTVFVDDKKETTMSGLYSEVSQARALIRQKPGVYWALYEEDSGRFLVMLIALWLENRSVLLPPDCCEQTKQNVLTQVNWFQNDGNIVPGVKISEDAENSDLIVYTSGSTGQPSLVKKSLKQLSREVVELENRWAGDVAGSLVASTVSHQHIYGLLFRLLWPWACGHRFCSVTCQYPEQILDLVQRNPVSLVSSPSHLQRLPEYLDWSGSKEKFRICFSSAGPLKKEFSHRTQSLLSCPVFEVFGSSETGGIAFRYQDDVEVEQLWQPFTDIEIRVEAGLLELQSPYLTSEQWFKTNDRIEMFANGRFQVLGRSDRIVKVEGKRTSLHKIELALTAHEWLSDAKALLLQRKREEIGVVVRLSQEGRAQLERIGAYKLRVEVLSSIKDSFEMVVVPRRWRIVDTFPEDAQGKITQSLLHNLFKEPNHDC